MNKEELKNLKIKERSKTKKTTDYNWIIKIIIITFTISMIMSFTSNTILPNTTLIFGIIIILFFILIGILFDMIGVSVTTANISVFNSMASRKVKGAKLAVKFKQNADKVSSFCNDVIGDICGVVSGACCINIASTLATKFTLNYLLTSLITTAIVSSITIGGKALGKNIAINQSEIILYRFCTFLTIFYKEKNN